TSHQLNGLTAGTSYDYRMRSNCTGLTSDWTTTVSFIVPVPCTDQYEPNGSIASATIIQLPASLNASIGNTTDNDYFSFTTDQTSNISINLSNLAGDYDLRLLEPNGDPLGLSQNSGTQPEFIYLPNAAAGTYIRRIYGWNGAHSTSVCYSLNVTSAGGQGCGTPQDPATFSINTTSAMLTWNNVQGAGSYDIQWREQGSPDWNSITNTPGSNTPLNNLVPGTTYEWRVRSICTGGASLYSSTVTFTTLEDPCYFGVHVLLRVWLDGAYDQSTQLMRDDLRAQGLVPLQEPYTAMGYNVEGPASTSPAVLAVTGTNAVVDWVLVESRPATDPDQVISTRAGLLLRNGAVVSPVNGTDPLNMCLPA